MYKKIIVLTLAVLLSLVVTLPALGAGWQRVDVEGVRQMMEHEDPLVVFPLSRIEYNNLHIAGSVNIPLSRLAAELPDDKQRTLIFYCLGTKCTASPNAADKAVELGYRNVYAFIEGLPAWVRAGYPTRTIERLPLAAIENITPEKLKKKLVSDSTTVLIDIRQKHDLAKGRIEHKRSVQIPLDDLIERLGEIPRDADVVICCQKGKRGPTAVRYLKSKGYSSVACLRGGFLGWAQAGLPLVK